MLLWRTFVIAEIKTIVSEDVTMQKVIGIPTGYELVTCLKEFYAGYPTKFVMWDLSACSLEQVRADDLRQIVSFVRSYAHTRLEDKTAIVAPSDANHLQDELNKSQSHNDLHLLTLIKELDDFKYRMDRLCDAIENGILPIEVAQERSRKIQSRRQVALAEMAGLRNQQEFPLKDFGPKRINNFCNALRTKLSDKESNFGKDYLMRIRIVTIISPLC